MDPLGDLASFVIAKIKEGVWAAWLKLLFEMGFSAVVSFLFICGTVLLSSNSWTAAIGSGMISSAVSLTWLFRREQSKLTRGMIVALPAQEANTEINTNLQTIEKGK